MGKTPVHSDAVHGDHWFVFIPAPLSRKKSAKKEGHRDGIVELNDMRGIFRTIQRLAILVRTICA
jgi:hypothetical protein